MDPKLDKTIESVEFRSRGPNIEEFRSRGPNWSLNWAAEPQSRSLEAWLGLWAGWGKAPKSKKSKNPKPQKWYSLGPGDQIWYSLGPGDRIGP